MSDKTIHIQGIEIRIEAVNEEDYVNLNDMSKNFKGEPSEHIRNWLRNGSTLSFLAAWEKINNEVFNLVEFHQIKNQFMDNTFIMSVKKWTNLTGAIGIKSKAGRYGGTYAHADIALQFAAWLSPEFYVYLINEFKRLKEEEFERKNLEWHISKITDNVDEIRNLLDTIPHQKPSKNRLKTPKKNKK